MGIHSIPYPAADGEALGAKVGSKEAEELEEELEVLVTLVPNVEGHKAKHSAIDVLRFGSRLTQKMLQSLSDARHRIGVSDQSFTSM
jgi:hypothetical protein